MQCVILPPPPLPTQYYLGCKYARSLPLKAPPISGLPTFLNPPFAGFSQAFPALETPLNPEHCSMYPYILFYNPLFKIFRSPKREIERRKKNLFKRNLRVKSQIPPPLFLNTILGPDFVARKVPLYRRFWEHACGPSDPGVGGGGGGGSYYLSAHTKGSLKSGEYAVKS